MLKNARLIIIILAVLIALPGVFAVSSFEVFSSQDVKETCPSYFVVYEYTVKNTGNEIDSYTVSKSGLAANWALVSPSGFVLDEGESQEVYVYVTPSKNALTGDYSLNLNFDSEKASSQKVESILRIKECHSVEVSSLDKEDEICLGEFAEFSFEVKNNGLWTETFDIELTGSLEEHASLSKEIVRLEPNTAEEVKIQVDTSSIKPGLYYISGSVDSRESDASDTEEFSLNVEGCYGFSVDSESYAEQCENSRVDVPIVIENLGKSSDVFEISVSGPDWVSVSRNEISLAGRDSREFDLVLSPDYGDDGIQDFKIRVSSVEGGETKEMEFKSKVNSCYGVRVDISEEKDVVCAGNSVIYPVSVKNLGEFDEEIVVFVDSEFASIDESFLNLASEESEEFSLEISTPKDASSSYDVEVFAELQKNQDISDKDKIEISVPSKQDCFGVNIDAELKKVSVAYGEAALVPIIIENVGIEKRSYVLDMSGNGVNYASLNPSAIELEKGSSEAIHLYISVPVDASQDEYEVIVSARDEEGIVSSSTKVSFYPYESSENDTISPINESVDTEKSFFMRFFSGIYSWFVGEEATGENETASFETEENLTGAEEEAEPEVEEEPVIEETPLEENVTENKSAIESEQEKEFVFGYYWNLFKSYWYLVVIGFLIFVLSAAIVRVAFAEEDSTLKNMVFDADETKKPNKLKKKESKKSSKPKTKKKQKKKQGSSGDFKKKAKSYWNKFKKWLEEE